MKRKNFGAKTYLYPQPVFIIGSYDENQVPDAMNAAWGGICDYEKIFLCLSAEHKTVKNILKRKAFSVSMANTANMVACDYVGIVSANDVLDKVKQAGWTTTKSEFVDAPIINELPLTLECEMESFDEKTDNSMAKYRGRTALPPLTQAISAKTFRKSREKDAFKIYSQSGKRRSGRAD